MTSRALVLDTTDTVIYGKGNVNLANEQIDLYFRPYPEGHEHSLAALAAETGGHVWCAEGRARQGGAGWPRRPGIGARRDQPAAGARGHGRNRAGQGRELRRDPRGGGDPNSDLRGATDAMRQKQEGRRAGRAGRQLGACRKEKEGAPSRTSKSRCLREGSAGSFANAKVGERCLP